MRGIVPLFVAFQVRRQHHHHPVDNTVGVRMNAASLPFTSSMPPSWLSPQQSEVDRKLEELLQAANEIGPIGSLASEQDQQRIQELADAMIPYSIPRPAQYPLKGEFRLVYSGTSGASSGRLFGTKISGTVKQVIVDDAIFKNHVSLGPLEMTMKAQREVETAKELKITLLEMKAKIFGMEIFRKQMDGADNTGTWKLKFVGITKDKDGKEKLIRIMQAPNLFILEQDLE